ncbi:ThuA domain-containing protein [Halorussus salinisoli]|uniref:ThuA domain-containing protein n=1 Tax=Halorussus salinisoli TaxID=2558242 RepID=UPI0010C23E0F|nr:ThuA domain-containing protein [Halorussus salinisoli]
MPTKLSVLAIGGNRFPFHRFDESGPLLANALDNDSIEVTLTTGRDVLTDLSGYDVVLDYLTDSTLEDEQRDGLLSFVRNGGGYVGVHCAADLTTTAADGQDELIDGRDAPFPELRNLLGGHFVTHPEQTAFDVRIVDSYHPISASLSDIRVWDEPYVLNVDVDDVRVLARMDHPEYADMPVAWVREFYDGRVFYSSLGHGEPALSNVGVRELLRRAVRWAGGR